jgi:2-oxoglutarate dehydrogenase E1 component
MGKSGGIDWGHAEALAFASLLVEGQAVRITGQDVERGTFSHRQAVLHDAETGQTYTPLEHLPEAKAKFEIYNSPLSETAVLGFEYGYSTATRQALVLWEAQFGDFVNVAQPIIDQFIVADHAKWGQDSGVTMLLPHGYEGQGPEHSSARLERFLQSAAESNMSVAYLSTPAQYYHILRRQALRGKRRPLFSCSRRACCVCRKRRRI